MLPFALTIFTGAFLLFQVQPLIGKYILPWFGGTPGVWTTCLLFFQLLLLGGYAYAHVLSSRLKPRQQVVVHLALLGVALAMLPITPDNSWKPDSAADPTWHILLLLGASIGLPYFALSATGPLVQHWFSRANPGASPYRLYALSNVGSLLALVSYPFVFEPRLTRQDQAFFWSIGLVAYVVFCGWCAFQLFRRRTEPDSPGLAGSEAQEEARASGRDKVLWVVMPAVASTLLVATTNRLSQDVAVIPFLWVMPLALYLLSFILCFDHPRWYSRGFFSAVFVGSLGVVGVLLMNSTSIRLGIQVAGYATCLFSACMICHGELYRLKPAPRYLTQYYLYIAAGGALGGCYVGVLAPLVFSRYVELQMGLALLVYLIGVICLSDRSRALAVGCAVGALLSSLLAPVVLASKRSRLDGWVEATWNQVTRLAPDYGYYALGLLVFFLWVLVGLPPRWKREWNLRMVGIPMSLSLVTGILFIVQIGDEVTGTVETSRNFYGTLTVVEWEKEDERLRQRALTHGSITHGFQLIHPPLNRLLTSYYGEKSGVGRAIDSAPTLGGRKIGIVGLGAGTIAMYGSTGDKIRFYEINPDVERVAREHFTFLEESSAETSVVLGDARLVLEQELNRGDLQSFDVLALDAFSSDAIPVHLLTKEAFELYLQHMNWGGIIAVHTSNRFLDLEPAVYRVAMELGLHVAVVSDEPDDDQWWLYRSTWVLLSRTSEALSHDNIVGGIGPLPIGPKPVRLWTDDFASIFPLLK